MNPYKMNSGTPVMLKRLPVAVPRPPLLTRATFKRVFNDAATDSHTAVNL
jgi:hypothetical protein